MLKVVNSSGAIKLGPIAATYRAGEGNMYATCPATCPLLKEHYAPGASREIDQAYLAGLVSAVPNRGFSWTYSHFPFAQLPTSEPRTTVINFSADTIEAAMEAMAVGVPSVYTAPANDKDWPRKVDGRRFVRCPAETVSKVTCRSCGGGRPLCARGERDYVVVFTAHGIYAKRIGSIERGGRYADAGPHTRIAWRATAQGKGAVIADADLGRWVRTLPPGTLLRHHVAGGIGVQHAGQARARRVIPVKAVA